LRPVLKHLVHGVNDVSGIDHLFGLVEKYLPVPKHPISEAKKQVWAPSHDLYRWVVQIYPVKLRLPVNISKEQLLSCVNVDHREGRDRKQKRECHPVHEGGEHHHENEGYYKSSLTSGPTLESTYCSIVLDLDFGIKSFILHPESFILFEHLTKLIRASLIHGSRDLINIVW